MADNILQVIFSNTCSQTEILSFPFKSREFIPWHSIDNMSAKLALGHFLIPSRQQAITCINDNTIY